MLVYLRDGSAQTIVRTYVFRTVLNLVETVCISHNFVSILKDRLLLECFCACVDTVLLLCFVCMYLGYVLWQCFVCMCLDKTSRGRNSSLVVFGLTVHSVAGSILLWGNFPVEGIFPLELTWVLNPFPKKLFQVRV